MSQHTPGPWKLSTRTGVLGPDDKIVAQPHPSRGKDEQKANARLIAKAPEMLAFLTAVATVECFNPRRPNREFCPCFSCEARALLKKIEG